MELNTVEKGDNIIDGVMPGSIAEELEIERGDILISANGKDIVDIIDYKYITTDELVTLLIKKADGELWELEIEKEYAEDIGLTFTNPLIDSARSCTNKCIFCFIDQLPKGMRETLYFKDDDSRLSFLQGNFITLTNLSEEEIDRIIEYRISPVNVSVHTTNPELRKKMLCNKNAGKLYGILERFSSVNIGMNCQIVLVPHVNDGAELERTLRDLSALYPNVNSVAVVPIGVTKFRQGLHPVETFNHDTSEALVDIIGKMQGEFLEKLGTRFVFASDEFFVLADEEIPSEDDYEGFPQIENGIGLIRSFKSEVEEELEYIEGHPVIDKRFVIPTGTLAYEFMKKIADMMMEKFEHLDIEVVPIKNRFFGETITVTGLLTATDIIDQLKGIDLGDGLFITKAMLKSDEDIFLDNITLDGLKELLGKEITVTRVDGHEFVDAFMKNMR